VGGDFNVDFARNWNNTLVLNNFCASADLFPVSHNDCSKVDYTHHFCMNHFTAIDHFLASDSLYKNAVKELFVMHDVDNTSDHEPLCITLELHVMRLKYSNVSDVRTRRHLRSAASLTLTVPTTRRTTLGDRAFPVAATHAWNA